MRKLKLIWDFKGPNAAKTAEHHKMHLEEFVMNQTTEVFQTAHKIVNEIHACSYIIIKEEDMRLFRDQLKPHRGEWLED